MLSHTVWRPLPLPKAAQAAPARTDKVAYGRYLVTHALECYPCHSADFKTMNIDEPEKTPGYLGGNNALVGLSQERIYSANITPDVETGIGTWTEAQLKRALRDGIRPDNTLVRYPMEPMRDLDDQDVAAIYAYLKQVPAIHKRRHASPPPAVAASASDGQKIYYKYGCNSCHGETGVGVGDLRVADKKYATDDALDGVDPQRAVVQARHQDADVGRGHRGERVRAAGEVRAQARARWGRRAQCGRTRSDSAMTLW